MSKVTRPAQEELDQLIKQNTLLSHADLRDNAIKAVEEINSEFHVHQNACYYRKPTRLERFVNWLFPQKGAPFMEEAPGFAESYYINDVTIHLDFVDRLRVLISGHILVSLSSKTDKPIYRMLSKTNVCVVPPFQKILVKRNEKG